jgi:hypothetical protein
MCCSVASAATESAAAAASLQHQQHPCCYCSAPTAVAIALIRRSVPAACIGGRENVSFRSPSFLRDPKRRTQPGPGRAGPLSRAGRRRRARLREQSNSAA